MVVVVGDSTLQRNVAIIWWFSWSCRVLLAWHVFLFKDLAWNKNVAARCRVGLPRSSYWPPRYSPSLSSSQFVCL